MKERSGDRHYKNVDFEKNLVIASGKETLGEAAPLWCFSHFGVETEDGKHCHLCHSRLKNWVAIKNTENGVVLIIGHDCYDKLISFLATKKLESLNLGSRKRYISEIKKYCKQHINESFLAWFETESGLPEILRSTLAFIKRFGYAPSLETAQAIVEHYKNNRLFEFRELINPNSRAAKVLSLIPISTNRLVSTKLTLAHYASLGLDCFNGVTDAEMGDAFFHQALRETLPENATSSEFAQWPKNARIAKAAILDEAWKKAVIQLQKDIAENQKDYRLLSFRKGTNPKHGTSQWECWESGKKYILARESAYSDGEGVVFCGIKATLVSDRVFLVYKLTLAPYAQAPLCHWAVS